MYNFKLNQAKKFFTVGFINQENKAQDGYFWSRSTNKHFSDRTSNWKTFVYPNGLVFICSKVTGQVRQVRDDYSIGCPIRFCDQKAANICIDRKNEFDGMLNAYMSGHLELANIISISALFNCLDK